MIYIKKIKNLGVVTNHQSTFVTKWNLVELEYKFKELEKEIQHLRKKCFTAAVESKDIETIPRVIRLSQKLELSEKECIALHFILMCNIGIHFPPPPSSLSTSMEMRSMAHAVATYAEMTGSELLEFLRPSRKHMKQNLFELDDEYSTIFNTRFLNMSPEVMRALTGNNLNEDEFFKIDKTALADVILEEKELLWKQEAENEQNGGAKKKDDDVNNNEINKNKKKKEQE